MLVEGAGTAVHFAMQGVGRHWGERVALADVDLQIGPGERVAVVGPSGGGKSTLLKLLVGRLRPSSGALLVNEAPISTMSPAGLRRHRRACAYVEQGGQIYPGLSVYRNVLAGRLAGWPWWRVLLSMAWPLQRADVEAVLAKVGLADRLWEPAAVLSGGQQQRVAIARALSCAPSVLLLDEPTAALDPATAEDMVALLLAHQEACGATLVWCTHWLSLIQSQMTRVLGIGGGRLVFDLAPGDVTEAQLRALYEGSDEHAR